MKNQQNLCLALALAALCACSSEAPEEEDPEPTPTYTTFQEDVNFLREYTEVMVLEEPNGTGRVAVAPALQGRVMTSSANGDTGRSYGWINRRLFESGDTLEHMNAFGGEERFWLGPEGGQYSIFFREGDPFDFEHWQTPRVIDLDVYDTVGQTSQKASFQKQTSLTNYSGFTFDLEIDRSVEVLPTAAIFQTLGLPPNDSLQSVGYRTTNIITNTGKEDWKKETGLLSIWLLGMFNPSDATTVIVPFETGDPETLGATVNDTYFGKVPAERLQVGEGVLFFTADGQYRSKIGLNPSRAKDILGAYDAQNQILTIVRYDKPAGVSDYVNSLWELQDEPYAGDAVNSYNDGPPEPGADPMGPFYELETSSPALALPGGESGSHTQYTFHFEGDAAILDRIARELLGVSLDMVP
ncbi:DUF6786 family protein [Flavilitoribacter nigricans]|uniref:Lipoprotein n=1 Tax=Flavilitoribacter nigricans (strain ATCC 23147 / DSM 23189 / NBRC 102662 / NCIMB 1420 / SS-2) TaxID=1122177 RepID=A0A2D0NLK3_FLAN2|nr:DUF6786 family protein [Flavilitoribacter nigricans]PHN08623.1 hypothetical protein CRP01_01540 [Flavilitoribacter nigricans DSM 23189 = NBRC 102662]